MMKFEIKGNVAKGLNHLFQMLLITYLLLLLTEQIWQGSVLLYLNINYLLVAVIIFGIISVFSEQTNKLFEEPTWKDYLFIGLLGAAGMVIIFIKTQSLGWLSYLISIIAGILIVLLSILVLEEKDEIEDKNENENKTKKNKKRN